jgi:hypothetical protein
MWLTVYPAESEHPGTEINYFPNNKVYENSFTKRLLLLAIFVYSHH